MKSLILAGTCGLALAVAAPVVQARPAADASASKVVASYVSEESGFSLIVSKHGKTRTAKVVKADGILCKGGADPDGVPADGVLRATVTLSSKGKYSGTFTGVTENNVPLKGTLKGTVTKKLATIGGTVTGVRNDPNEPPNLTCKELIRDSAVRSS